VRDKKVTDSGGPARSEAQKQIAYFEKNRVRMRYATFRAERFGAFVEAGCRTVIAQRLKNSGMFWSQYLAYFSGSGRLLDEMNSARSLSESARTIALERFRILQPHLEQERFGMQ